MAKRILSASQALPFRLHPIEEAAPCTTCGEAAELLMELDDRRDERVPLCLRCTTGMAMVCEAGDPQGNSSMPRTIRRGCVLRDAVGNRPIQYSPRCTEEVTAVVIAQGPKRHYRVRSEPLCARHAEMVEDAPGPTEDGGIRLGLFQIQRRS